LVNATQLWRQTWQQALETEALVSGPVIASPAVMRAACARTALGVGRRARARAAAAATAAPAAAGGRAGRLGGRVGDGDVDLRRRELARQHARVGRQLEGLRPQLLMQRLRGLRAARAAGVTPGRLHSLRGRYGAVWCNVLAEVVRALAARARPLCSAVQVCIA